MKTSESIVKISLAFLKAQKVMESAKKGEDNPYFKSKYADLPRVLEACKGPLNDNGISILQPTVTIEGQNYVETVLLHESGEYFSSLTKLEVKKENDPQAYGSAVSYGRRYGLQSLISLPAEDDDGENAMGRKTNITTSYKKKEVSAKSEPLEDSENNKMEKDAVKKKTNFRRKKKEVKDEL